MTFRVVAVKGALAPIVQPARTMALATHFQRFMESKGYLAMIVPVPGPAVAS